ncbi:MAG: twin-arginine translocase subunit TatC [Burkholderiales bacterium]|jgi:sec-independent protein translocase protein TatC|nr:twin-arginine translocase subunit TatC [Burkholderiales bacterium]
MSDQEQSVRQETFISHLIELRNRLLRSIIAILGVFLFLYLVFPKGDNIYTFLAQPLMAVLPEGTSMIATEVTAPFFVPLKVTLMAAFLITLPYILWQVWAFVAPGLYRHEKKLVIPVLLSSLVLFLIGMAFAYFIVFPVVFKFFASLVPNGVQMMTDINKYLGFVLTMFLAFGVTFETPVVVMVLIYMNIVTLEQFRNARPYIIVGAFVVAAVFTPPDVLSQLFLAFPLWLLYEFGMFLSRFITSRDARNQESEVRDQESGV